ncbi:uncharacterized protein TRUGW13939_00073 [Talaromyces rugulosus]|uniref:Transcription factor domain-containing protein n=1 Tax=Talaromyces rugulosus TaxID=121627 RepID=A0A7H8QHG2_TALRU|nr:uncharacterized protein TRUGW13939_00073 [Talaromyces rugulosus]QKX53002.1 hypothetical protein TRUGW13939_00073 [Talaromyces rugulosus]
MESGSPSHMSPETFTGHDLRFLHHFLITAYPHLPFGSEDLWKTSLPAYAHQCPHLMHAILSLGASHLSLISPRADEYTPLALSHRGRALKYLGDALATVDQCTKTDLDLILATTYALTFQANYMTDGLVDFAVMVRGCTTVTRKIRSQDQERDMFRLLMSEVIYARVCSQLPSTPCWDIDILEMSIEALEGIRPLLEANGHRINYHAILNIYRCMRISGRQGFIALSEFYNGWGSMDYQEFMDFLDPGNHVSRLLLIHYVAVTIMMKPVFSTFKPSMRETPKDTLANHQWGIGIYRGLNAKFRGLVELQYRFIVTDKAWIEAGGTMSASENETDVLQL